MCVCRYGVGQIYFRQEKYEMAEYHFRRSLQINQRSSVLRCYLGVALHKIGRGQEALEQLQVCGLLHHWQGASASRRQAVVSLSCRRPEVAAAGVCLGQH